MTAVGSHSLLFRDSGGIQTHNLLIRSQMLYSVELRNHSAPHYLTKVHTFFELTKHFGDFFLKKLEKAIIVCF